MRFDSKSENAINVSLLTMSYLKRPCTSASHFQHTIKEGISQ